MNGPVTFRRGPEGTTQDAQSRIYAHMQKLVPGKGVTSQDLRAAGVVPEYDKLDKSICLSRYASALSNLAKRGLIYRAAREPRDGHMAVIFKLGSSPDALPSVRAHRLAGSPAPKPQSPEARRRIADELLDLAARVDGLRGLEEFTTEELIGELHRRSQAGRSGG